MLVLGAGGAEEGEAGGDAVAKLGLGAGAETGRRAMGEAEGCVEGVGVAPVTSGSDVLESLLETCKEKDIAWDGVVLVICWKW